VLRCPTNGDLVPLSYYKNKGDIKNCNNHRGIKLFSHTMKLWEREEIEEGYTGFREPVLFYARYIIGRI